MSNILHNENVSPQLACGHVLPNTRIEIMSALQIAQAQRDADKAHHEQRVAWLSASNPTYEGGGQVKSSDRHEMLRSSQAYLANPSAYYGHCHCTPRCA